MNNPIDMSQFIEARSDQLNADDLIGRDLTITVTKVTGSDGDQPVAIHYQGDNGKPFKPCKTIRRVLVAIWGRYADEYVGRSMTLYRDDEVQFGGLKVGGIRIRAMSHLDKETVVVVAKSKGKKAGMKIEPLRVEQRQATDPAADWAAKFIAKVRACPHANSLDDLQAAQAKRLAELRTKRPELHTEIVERVAEQRAFLTPHDATGDTDPREGRSEDQHGDGFVDDGTGEWGE